MSTLMEIARYRALILPVLILIFYSYMFYNSTQWFEALPEPNNAQSVYMGALVAAIFPLLKFISTTVNNIEGFSEYKEPKEKKQHAD